MKKLSELTKGETVIYVDESNTRYVAQIFAVFELIGHFFQLQFPINCEFDAVSGASRDKNIKGFIRTTNAEEVKEVEVETSIRIKEKQEELELANLKASNAALALEKEARDWAHTLSDKEREYIDILIQEREPLIARG